MEKNKVISPGVSFLFFTGFFWVVRLLFIYSYTETTFPCEWRVGNIAREILTSPLLAPLQFLKYTCTGIVDAWQIIEGVLLAPFFYIFGSGLFTLKLLAALLSYLHFCGWYILVRRYISEKAAIIFALFYVFPLPFYLEGSLFLQGTHAQANFFIPYIFLLLFAVLKKDKNTVHPFILLGLLTAAGTYFTYEYYFLLFLAFSAIIIKKYAFRKEILAFCVSFFVFTAPFYIYSFVIKESMLDFRGRERSSFSGLETLIARFNCLVSRYYELFGYNTPKLLGVLLFLVFLISLIYILIFKYKNNKLIVAALMFFIILNLGRIFSKFDVAHPIGELFWGGRYFIFGFEMVILFIAYFLAAIERKPLGKVIFYILVASCMFPSLFFVFSNFNIAAINRKFPLGYNYEDIGNRTFFWNNKDYKKALSLIESKKEDQSDKEILVEGLMTAAIYYSSQNNSDINLETMVKEFSPIIGGKYDNTFYISLGKNIASKYRGKPKSFFMKLVEVEKHLSSNDYLYILQGIRQALFFESISEKEFLELIQFIDGQDSSYKDHMWEMLGSMGLGRSFLTENSFIEDSEYMANLLKNFPTEVKESILKGYFRKIVNPAYYGNYGSIYYILRRIKNQKFNYKALFLSILKETYEPIYGQTIIKIVNQ